MCLIMKFSATTHCSFIYVFLVLLLFARGNTIAQEFSKDSVSYNLPEIVVIASPITIPTPNIVREANTKDFESWNTHNVAEALSQSVGMNIQVGASRGGANVWVRGFKQRDIQVLLDGIPISSAYEGDLDLNEVAIDNITKIKMIKGTPSVVYGANAMGGVIDIIPKTAFNTNSKHGVIEIGEHLARLFRASFGGQNKILNYFISANYEESNGYSLSHSFSIARNEDGGLRENSDYSRKSFFVHLNSQTQPIGNYSFFFNFSNNERGFPPEVGITNPDYLRNESTRQTIGLVNRFSFLPISARFFYNLYRGEMAYYTDSTYSEIELVDEAKDHSIGGSLYSNLLISKDNILILNLSLKDDVYEGADKLEDLNKPKVSTYTIAAENELSIKDRLFISVGGIFCLVRQAHNDESTSVLNPQIVVGYEIKKNVVAHVSVAQRTRFPTLRELFRKRYGNPNLKEQKATNYEIGIRLANSGKIQADLTFFLNNLYDLIERKSQKSIYENLQMATLKGIEFSSGGWLSNDFFGRIGYTLLEGEEILPENISRPLRNRPRHSAAIELRYKFPFNIILNLNGIYVAEIFEYDVNENIYCLPNYILLNTKVSQRLLRIMDAYVAFSNITDSNYEHRLGFPREGRTWRLGMNIDF